MAFGLQTGQVGTIGKYVAMVNVSVPPINDRRNHTLLVLDCSGSMTEAIDDVRRDSQEYVNGLDENDFVSVIIFSGHGRARLIAGPTQCNLVGKELLRRSIRSEVRVLDTTVFSEPLELCIATAKSLAKAEITHNAVLFTDGCAVPTRWDVITEQNKALTAVRTLRNLGVIVSVIGYGVYYDESFINQLMQAAGNEGVFRHISEIEEFGPVISHIRETFTRTVIAYLNLTFTPNKGSAGKVFKTTPQLVVSGEGGHLSTKGLYEGKATLFVELSCPCSTITVSGTINGKPISETLKAEKLSDENAADFVRVLGAYAFLTGDHATAAQMLALTQDEGMAEKATSAYTQREQREAGDIFRRFFVDRKFIGAGLKPTGPSHSVLNVLRVLIEDPGNVVYIPKGAYKRSGELTKDPRVVESPLGRVLKVVSYKSHVDRFNFSITCKKDVKVMPENGDSPVDMKVWRTYNIILDGNLHLPELEAVLSEPSFNVLKEAGVIDAEKYVPGKLYTVNLRKLKMISPNWANPTTLGLVNLMKEEAELEAEQTALNTRKKAVGAPAPVAEEAGGLYIEKAVKVEGIPVEYYTANCCEYRLLGYKAAQYVYSTMTYPQADARVREVRHRLIVVRFLIRAITFAMELVGSTSVKWDAGKDVTRMGTTKLEQNAVYLGAQLKRVTWTEQIVCS